MRDTAGELWIRAIDCMLTILPTAAKAAARVSAKFLVRE
jgi:hypothetical protein